MSFTGLSKDSIRDISGNLVPLVILGFFTVWIGLEGPWEWDLLTAVIVYGLFVGLGCLLFAVTYATALAIDAAEAGREAPIAAAGGAGRRRRSSSEATGLRDDDDNARDEQQDRDTGERETQ